jgi:hypothetical protein
VSSGRNYANESKEIVVSDSRGKFHLGVTDQKSLLLGLSILIIALGIWRAIGLVLHEPLLGYANNTDMIRIQACVQIWPADSAIKEGSMTPAAPISDYKLEYHSSQENLCLPSSELVFIYLGRSLAKFFHLKTIPIRLFGMIEALAFSSVALLFGLLLVRRRQIVPALAHAIIWTVILADPINTLYLNTFYSEFASIFFTYVSFALLWLILAVRETRFRALALGTSLFLLGVSRYQHLGLPVAIGGVLIMVNLGALRRIKWTTVAVSFASLAVLIFYGRYQMLFPWTENNTHYINYANATDTYLGAVLPASDEPAEAATALGLPDQCADDSGKTWYTPGVQAEHPCPEVLGVSRFALLRLTFRNPAILYRMIEKGIPLLRPLILALGGVGGEEFGRADRLVFTLSTGLDKMPNSAMVFIFGVPMLATILVAYASVVRRPNRVRPALTVIGGLAVACSVVFMSALFGDGYFEFQKHTQLFFSLWCSLIVVVVALLTSRLAKSGAVATAALT